MLFDNLFRYTSVLFKKYTKPDMAPSAVDTFSPAVTPTSSSKITQNASSSPNSGFQFDSAKHLAYSPPSKVLTMKDLGLEPTALSSIATTEPFPLLSHEAVLQHRRDIFSKDVLDSCLHHTRPGSVQIRGMAPRYSPFIHQFWHSAEVLKIVSDIAGVELVPAMDYEISHVNVQLGPGGLEAVRSTPVEPPEATEEAIKQYEGVKPQKQAVTDQSKPIIEWHVDSHPWVCVVMLSDARHMTGGETELMKGDGTTLKVKAPQMVRNRSSGLGFAWANIRSRAALSCFRADTLRIPPLRSPTCLNALQLLLPSALETLFLSTILRMRILETSHTSLNYTTNGLRTV
jgi:hypothetical protein